MYYEYRTHTDQKIRKRRHIHAPLPHLLNNRRVVDRLDADVVIGPIANDTIFDTMGIFSSHFTCYCVDSRGHGRSTPVQKLHYEDMAQDIQSAGTAEDIETREQI